MQAGSVNLFADEVTIYCCIKKTADKSVAQWDKALNKLHDWCILNCLPKKAKLC